MGLFQIELFSQGEEQQPMMQMTSSCFREDGEAHGTDYLINDAD